MMYDQDAAAPGWQPKIFAVQLKYKVDEDTDGLNLSRAVFSDLFT